MFYHILQRHGVLTLCSHTRAVILYGMSHILLQYLFYQLVTWPVLPSETHLTRGEKQQAQWAELSNLGPPGFLCYVYIASREDTSPPGGLKVPTVLQSAG